MAMKTVKKVVDEFKNREKKNTIDHVGFFRNGRGDSYSNVTNLYRDGVKVEEIDLDYEEHKYEFDSGFNEKTYDKNYPLKWTHRVFFARIVEYTNEIEE